MIDDAPTARAAGSRSRRVVVIGAGLAGLSAACHLRGRGYDVHVIEAANVPGGRAGTLEIDGYRFDTGPTVLTMPNLVDDCFRAVGAEPGDHLTVKRVDPMYRACFDDGSQLHVRHGRQPMADEIASLCGPDQAAAFHRFCDWLTELYHLEMPNFIDRNFDSPMSLMRPIGPVLQLLKTGAFGRLESAVRTFFRDERLVRIFSFQAMYAGLAPRQALALYAVITYMDSVNGVFVPVGGMHALPRALAAAAADAGVTFEYSRRVERIMLAHGTTGRVRGVRMVGGEVLAADAVVCSPDLPVAYRHLLPGIDAPRRARRGKYSPSALVWHAGVAGDLAAGTAHHNIHFGKDWDGAFRSLLKEGTQMRDPSILVTVPTVDEPSMAPPGRHVLYVLEPAPNLDGVVDWTKDRGPARERLIAQVGDLGYPVAVEVDHFVDPLDWEAQGMERGTPFALAHTFFQTGPFRPGNTERNAPGLVFAGSGTVPGVGVPMVLISGKLAAARVDQLALR
ncbi:MAG: phytoene desaturase family protein [Ilumatobacteraceae bacterium]